jgi:hypothetical protein
VLAWQLAPALGRPDAIGRLWSTADLVQALGKADEQLGPVRSRLWDVRTELPELMPPLIRLSRPADGAIVAEAVVELRGTLRAVGGSPISDVNVLLNGRKIPPPGDPRTGYEVRLRRKLFLLPGENRVQVTARTGRSITKPASLRVFRRHDEP